MPPWHIAASAELLAGEGALSCATDNGECDFAPVRGGMAELCEHLLDERIAFRFGSPGVYLRAPVHKVLTYAIACSRSSSVSITMPYITTDSER